MRYLLRCSLRQSVSINGLSPVLTKTITEKLSKTKLASRQDGGPGCLRILHCKLSTLVTEMKGDSQYRHGELKSLSSLQLSEILLLRMCEFDLEHSSLN